MRTSPLTGVDLRSAALGELLAFFVCAVHGYCTVKRRVVVCLV